MSENFVVLVAVIGTAVCGVVGVWNNWIGHNPSLPYSSRAPILKFYGYPLWNCLALLSGGLLQQKSWREEHNRKLAAEGLHGYIC